MHFLLDANSPRSTRGRLIALGHDAIDVRDIGLRHSPDAMIAEHARNNRLALITQDGDFGDVRNYPPAFYHGIVVLDLPPDVTAR